MASTNFVNGTVVQPEWLNDVDDVVYRKAKEIVSVKDAPFNARGDGVTDDTAALELARIAAQSGVVVEFPAGVYLTDPVTFTAAGRWKATGTVRIVQRTAGTHTIKFDAGSFWFYGAGLDGFVIDSNGLAPYSLWLAGVISSDFPNIRCTNSTLAGLRLAWAQLCTFKNYTCSHNVEAFTTTPVHGVIADVQSSSANYFENITVEHVSGAGVRGIALLNTIFLNGTSEGNLSGFDFGEDVVGSLTCIGNTVIGCDLEVNSGGDVILRRTAGSNDFISLKAGFNSGTSKIISSNGNVFYGGICGGIEMDADSFENVIEQTKLLGATATITDLGTRNGWVGVRNISTGERLTDKKQRGRSSAAVAGGGTAVIDCSLAEYFSVTCTGSTANIGAPIKVADAAEIDIRVLNVSGGALSVTWNAIFKMSGWTNPESGTGKNVRFRYDAGYGVWYQTGPVSPDVVI